MSEYTHADLVERGAKWLRGSIGCQIVATELMCGGSYQIPDCIGFKSDRSYLIEVKVSRSDFFADRKKYHMRSPDKSVGNFRWYLSPPGLLAPADLPEGWGLLEPSGDRMKVIVGSTASGKTVRNDSGGWDFIPPKAGIAHNFQDQINLRSERAMIFSIALRAQNHTSVSAPEKRQCANCDWSGTENDLTEGASTSGFKGYGCPECGDETYDPTLDDTSPIAKDLKGG